VASGNPSLQYPHRRALNRPTSLASGSQRALFVLALLTFGLASIYTGVATLARVTPALFPGKSLSNLRLVAALDFVAPIPEASATGSFTDPIRILVLGVDKRAGVEFQDGENGAYLTDVVMVAQLDPITKKITLLSFPRDLVIDIHRDDGFVYGNRINESYSTGVKRGGTREAGIAQVERDLKENFGIDDIDHYAIIDFSGVEGLVDAVGGVTVNIPEDLTVPEWAYSNDDRTVRYLSFPEGEMDLDGYTAVAFGRYRDTDSDLSRIHRQQLVVKAALSKAFTAGVLGRNPTGLWDAYNGLVKTNVPRSLFPGYAGLLESTGGNLETYSLGDPVNETPTVWPGMLGDASVLFSDPDNVRYWLARAFPTTRHPDADVELQNAYGDLTLGNSRTTALGYFLVYAKGMVTVHYGADQPERPDTVVILTRDAQRSAAQDIVGWLGLPPERLLWQPVAAGDTATPDILVVVGRDFVIPETAPPAER